MEQSQYGAQAAMDIKDHEDDDDGARMVFSVVGAIISIIILGVMTYLKTN